MNSGATPATTAGRKGASRARDSCSPVSARFRRSGDRAGAGRALGLPLGWTRTNADIELLQLAKRKQPDRGAGCRSWGAGLCARARTRRLLFVVTHLEQESATPVSRTLPVTGTKQNATVLGTGASRALVPFRSGRLARGQPRGRSRMWEQKSRTWRPRSQRCNSGGRPVACQMPSSRILVAGFAVAQDASLCGDQ
jgi:hypothetical protein